MRKYVPVLLAILLCLVSCKTSKSKVEQTTKELSSTIFIRDSTERILLFDQLDYWLDVPRSNDTDTLQRMKTTPHIRLLNGAYKGQEKHEVRVDSASKATVRNRSPEPVRRSILNPPKVPD